MCKSVAEGGQRCATRARARYIRTPPFLPAWDTVAAEYASTPEGEQELRSEAQTKMDARDFDAAARLYSAIIRGVAMRQANRETADRIRAAAASPDATGRER